MKNVKISIIVPVYNMEQYIGETIESVLKQTMSDWELILVNDGSNDRSLDICRDYATHNVRIKVIDMSNSGVSAARRCGLQVASGEYVTFLDGDDLLFSDALEYAYRTLKLWNVDMLSGSVQRGLESGAKIQRLKDKLYNMKSYSEAHARYKIKMGLHADFIRRSALMKHQVIIDRTIVNNEDYLFKLFVIQDINTVYTTSKVLHLYRYREGSACHREYPVAYWYHYFEYFKSQYVTYNVHRDIYLISKLTKLTSLIRNHDYEFDFQSVEISDLKELPINIRLNIYTVLTLISVKMNSRIFIPLLKFHPQALLKNIFYV